MRTCVRGVRDLERKSKGNDFASGWSSVARVSGGGRGERVDSDIIRYVNKNLIHMFYWLFVFENDKAAGGREERSKGNRGEGGGGGGGRV